MQNIPKMIAYLITEHGIDSAVMTVKPDDVNGSRGYSAILHTWGNSEPLLDIYGDKLLIGQATSVEGAIAELDERCDFQGHHFMSSAPAAT